MFGDWSGHDNGTQSSIDNIDQDCSFVLNQLSSERDHDAFQVIPQDVGDIKQSTLVNTPSDEI